MRRINLEVREYQKDDCLQLNLMPETVYWGLPLGWENTYTFYNSQGPAYTAFYQAKMLFCMGIFIPWPGMGEAWLLCDRSVELYAWETFSTVRDYLDRTIEELDLSRVQARVLARWERSYRMTKKLGFKVECLMPKHGPGQEDYYMFARVK